MNNIINIRLGHYLLAADEDAAQLLRNYSTALKNKFAAEAGAAEIVADIEERIGELLQQKQEQAKRNFTTLADVEEVLAQMGPADSDETQQGNASSHMPKSDDSGKRRLYRDTDQSILGGVCAGIAAYFDIDPVFVRLFWALTVFGFGFGVLLYIILWVIVPEARSTAEKLMMRGQTPNLQNIEENVKAEFRRVEDQFQSGGRERFSRFVGQLVSIFGKVVRWAVKVAVSVVLALMIAGFIAVMIAFTTHTFHIETWNLEIAGKEGLNVLLSAAGEPFWIKTGVITMLVLAILSALMILIPSVRRRPQMRLARRYTVFAMLLVFFVMFFTTIISFAGIRHHAEKNLYSEDFACRQDTIYLSSDQSISDHDGFYTCNNLVDIQPSSDSNVHIEQHTTAWGYAGLPSSEVMRKTPRQYTWENGKLIFTESNKITNIQKQGLSWSRLVLYVPKGKVVKTSASFFAGRKYPNWVEGGQTYQIDSNGFAFPYGKTGHYINLPAIIRDVRIEGRFEVQIIPASQNRIEILSGPLATHQHWIETSDYSLHIESHEDWNESHPSVLRLYVKDLSDLEVSATATAWIRNLHCNSLRLAAESASHIRGNVQCEHLEIRSESASGIHLEGMAGNLELKTAEASVFEGALLKVKVAEAEISSASTATIWAGSSIRAEVDAASKLYIKGKPDISDIRTSGLGRVETL